LNQQWQYEKNSEVADSCFFKITYGMLGKKWNHHWNHIGVGGGYFKEDNFSDTCHYLFNARTSQ